MINEHSTCLRYVLCHSFKSFYFFTFSVCSLNLVTDINTLVGKVYRMYVVTDTITEILIPWLVRCTECTWLRTLLRSLWSSISSKLLFALSLHVKTACHLLNLFFAYISYLYSRVENCSSSTCCPVQCIL